jgi:phosphotransferase system HPr (HPr) family protein
MKEVKVVVDNEVGLHARPAALFVQEAAKFNSDINVYCQDPESKEDRNANAKSILGILTLGVFKGMEITIKAEGDDEDTAVETLKAMVEDNFGEK